MNLPVSIEVNEHQLMCGCKHTHRHHTTRPGLYSGVYAGIRCIPTSRDLCRHILTSVIL